MSDRITIHHGDCLGVLQSFATGCVDLTITSPPYEGQRTYGIDFKLKGQAWVDWLAVRVVELLTRHAPAAVVGLRNFGKNNPAVRPLLLRAFAQAAGAN